MAGATQGIRPAVVGDLGDVAAIHQRAFPRSVLAQLGEQAVARYYRWLLTGPHEAVFLVHEGARGIDGFVVGGRFRDAMGGFLARNKLFLAHRVLLRPGLLFTTVGRRRLSVPVRSFTTWSTAWARRKAPWWPGPVPWVHDEPAPAARLYRCLALAVSPEQQGRRVGQALMAGLTAAAMADGVPRIQLGVDPDNARAIRFYELQGFGRMSQYNDWFGARAGKPGNDTAWWGLMEKLLPAAGDHRPGAQALPPPGRRDADTAEEVTVVVVVRDRLSTFPACLAALYAHTDTPFQVLVVVGGADPATRRYLDDLARQHGNLRAIHREAPLSPDQARRLAIPQLGSRRCVFLENDTIVHAGWLRPLLACAREEAAAVVTPLIFWYRGLHAAGGSFARIQRDGAIALMHAIEYRDVRRKRIGYAETHCILVDLEQLTAADLCDPVEPSDVDLGLTLEQKGCTVFLEPRSVVTYAAPPPLEVRDIAHSLQRWDLKAWQDSHARFVEKWNLRYDASAKHASYRRQALRLALLRRYPTAAAVAVTNASTYVSNCVATTMTFWRSRRSFG